MARYSGEICYVFSKEVEPGKWEAQEIIRKVTGNIENSVARSNDSSKVNEDTSVTLRISVVADAFAFSNFMSIKWITYAGKKWHISSIEIFKPRLVLNIGRLYNG